jgi:hypothetical protein
MSVEEDMTRDFRSSASNMKCFEVSVLEFQAACLRFDWKAAQVHHHNAVDSIDAFFDNMAAAYKRLETANGGVP